MNQCGKQIVLFFFHWNAKYWLWTKDTWVNSKQIILAWIYSWHGMCWTNPNQSKPIHCLPPSSRPFDHALHLIRHFLKVYFASVYIESHLAQIGWVIFVINSLNPSARVSKECFPAQLSSFDAPSLTKCLDNKAVLAYL